MNSVHRFGVQGEGISLDFKVRFPSSNNASILKVGRVVFNVCGDEFRLIVWINYDFYAIYIRFIGTHAE